MPLSESQDPVSNRCQPLRIDPPRVDGKTLNNDHRGQRVAADRHSSPETKRHYELGMVDEVREGIERANEHSYQNQKLLRFYYDSVRPEKEVWKTSVSG